MKYDMHIHSCLSPCANDDCTPAAIAGFAKLAGADIISVCDHNSALNLPAVKAACDEYDLALLPGIEVTTAEEIHILCYFPSVDAALKMGAEIYASLPSFKYDEIIWGKQLVMNENDEIIQAVTKLLTSACGMDIYEVFALCKSLGGIAVPAHADKDSYSILSVLGFAPEDLFLPIIELKNSDNYKSLSDKGFLPKNAQIITSSDAHCLEQVACNLSELTEGSYLYRIISM